ncbi:hypothetical protein NBO_389g0009 [Nosema bombycis CQ1]|uniref:Uncharacterized protein n=1 Tax=Nosema bombycis (strain CQ1 / CVCC 102059) TaxID=578461 RepID=R0MIL0_NOSB1|nr:hypothetical protein NBO_389g0009 [Nosema bombycis CQ1]|eukprot:EOB12638.1 hypothetical protein NBO_389g0009 [Nosema bombycis CQ1]
MLYHPYTLTLLTKFKETNDETLLKEILGLLIDSQPFTQPFTDFKTKLYNDFYKIIFSNSEIKKSKKQNIKKLNEIINTQFHKVENDNKEYCYVLNDFEGINLKGKQLIKKNRRRKSNFNKNESVLDDVILDKKSKNINEILISFNTICDLIDCDKIYNDNKNLLTNITSKLVNIVSKMQENGIITKREY